MNIRFFQMNFIRPICIVQNNYDSLAYHEACQNLKECCYCYVTILQNIREILLPHISSLLFATIIGLII